VDFSVGFSAALAIGSVPLSHSIGRLDTPPAPSIVSRFPSLERRPLRYKIPYAVAGCRDRVTGMRHDNHREG
jgi:hypothetical protein